MIYFAKKSFSDLLDEEVIQPTDSFLNLLEEDAAVSSDLLLEGHVSNTDPVKLIARFIKWIANMATRIKNFITRVIQRLFGMSKKIYNSIQANKDNIEKVKSVEVGGLHYYNKKLLINDFPAQTHVLSMDINQFPKDFKNLSDSDMKKKIKASDILDASYTLSDTPTTVSPKILLNINKDVDKLISSAYNMGNNLTTDLKRQKKMAEMNLAEVKRHHMHPTTDNIADYVSLKAKLSTNKTRTTFVNTWVASVVKYVSCGISDSAKILRAVKLEVAK